jgi:hypothetical protein
MEDKATAARIVKLREQAKDKSLPQDVRNTFLDRANQLEQEAAKKAGVKMAKGGLPVRGSRAATNMENKKKMMGGGYVAPMKKAMAKGGMAKKAKK